MEEFIKTYKIGENQTEIDLYGIKDESSEDYDFFDLFIADTGECLNEGDPLYSRPTQGQVERIYKEYVGEIEEDEENVDNNDDKSMLKNKNKPLE